MHHSADPQSMRNPLPGRHKGVGAAGRIGPGPPQGGSACTTVQIRNQCGTPSPAATKASSWLSRSTPALGATLVPSRRSPITETETT